jgi:hypothetical protein
MSDQLESLAKRIRNEVVELKQVVRATPLFRQIRLELLALRTSWKRHRNVCERRMMNSVLQLSLCPDAVQ